MCRITYRQLNLNEKKSPIRDGIHTPFVTLIGKWTIVGRWVKPLDDNFFGPTFMSIAYVVFLLFSIVLKQWKDRALIEGKLAFFAIYNDFTIKNDSLKLI